VYFLSLLAIALLTTESLGPGDHVRSLNFGGLDRSYHVHVPPQYDASKPTPVILAFHGGGTNAQIMAFSCGLNAKADDAGFIVVYPNGTGDEKLKLTWNSGGFRAPNGKKQPDDVAFTAAVIDDLAKVTNVDAKRIYATGMSNGGMMCYRLAAELSKKIAAIASVSGTMSVKKYRPKRPVAVIHFHGTADERVPFGGTKGGTKKKPQFPRPSNQSRKRSASGLDSMAVERSRSPSIYWTRQTMARQSSEPSTGRAKRESR
jgi:polyhydroxybutyrate depolymerase